MRQARAVLVRKTEVEQTWFDNERVSLRLTKFSKTHQLKGNRRHGPRDPGLSLLVSVGSAKPSRYPNLLLLFNV
jgi:hypothetical protein